MSEMTPREVVQELDKHIIGQADAKRAVAIALRNRWRRLQLSEKMSNEITPKNILMIGPTGVGKTEIARRLAKLAKAPFIKVEATKFTEVGYVGKEVDSIIRDLTELAITQVKSEAMSKVRHRAEEIAEEIILDRLLPSRDNDFVQGLNDTEREDNKSTRQTLRKDLREGKLDDKEIEIDVNTALPSFEVMAPPGMEEMTDQLQGMFKNLSSNKTKSQKTKIKDAIKILSEQEARKLINENEFNFCWIVDFPMFEIDEETKKLEFSHNPFSMPQGGMKSLLEEDPLKIKAYQYDIVCNGIELSSGAIRNHDIDIMLKAFEIAGYQESDIIKKFPALHNAFQYGAPPHGGIAPGIDRIVMLIADEPNIREVIMFPMNQKAEDLLMGAPNQVSNQQLKDLHIKVESDE